MALVGRPAPNWASRSQQTNLDTHHATTVSRHFHPKTHACAGQVPNEWNRLMRLSVEDRQAVADARAALFAERFHPVALFERAGVPSMLFK